MENKAQAALRERLNVIPIAIMCVGWLSPMLLFWGAAFGPLKPFNAPVGDTAPPPLAFLLCFGVSLFPALLTDGYFKPRAFETNTRLYERLGVRQFKRYVPDGDLVNRWMRRGDPSYRLIRDRQALPAYFRGTYTSEKGHLALGLMGLFTAAYAWQIGWTGWALFLTVGNVVVNLYPVLLQRYTRARIARLLEPPTLHPR